MATRVPPTAICAALTGSRRPVSRSGLVGRGFKNFDPPCGRAARFIGSEESLGDGSYVVRDVLVGEPETNLPPIWIIDCPGELARLPWLARPGRRPHPHFQAVLKELAEA
jgi:hypothetical protein